MYKYTKKNTTNDISIHALVIFRLSSPIRWGVAVGDGDKHVCCQLVIRQGKHGHCMDKRGGNHN